MKSTTIRILILPGLFMVLGVILLGQTLATSDGSQPPFPLVFAYTNEYVINSIFYTANGVQNNFQPQKMTIDARVWYLKDNIGWMCNASRRKCSRTYPNYCATAGGLIGVTAPDAYWGYATTKHNYQVSGCTYCDAPKQIFYTGSSSTYATQGSWTHPGGPDGDPAGCQYDPNSPIFGPDD